MPKRDAMMDRTPSPTGPARLADPVVGDFEQPAPDPRGSARRAGRPAVGPLIASSQPAAVSTAVERGPVFGAGAPGDRSGRRTGRLADRVLAGLSCGAGAFLVLLIGLVTAFLVIRALPAITSDRSSFLTARTWDVGGDTLDFGVLPLIWVTVLISLVAMVLAVPVAIGIALFISQYAPPRMARPVAYVIDLLAAIPSIIYGVWGIAVLAPAIQPVADALSRHAGWIPLFTEVNVKGGTIFTGGVVLAVMILPIITAIGRDVFERTPRADIEAAWALGATHWEVIRLAVLPYGRPGLVSGAMLGLGRALGETIAITLILSKVSNSGAFSFSIFNGGETFASKIANNASEFNSPAQTGAYIAAGLVLFVLTFAVNAAARWVVNRRKEFS